MNDPQSDSHESPLVAEVTSPPLRPLDRFLRSRRVRQLGPYLHTGSSVLDVGCHDGALFRAYADRISRGVGLDPLLERSMSIGRFDFISGTFPSEKLDDEGFDVITLLAVLEHVESRELPSWHQACERLLKPGGSVVVTVPSARVDAILDVLTRLRLIAGMSLDEHHSFDQSRVPALFSMAPLELVVRKRFELGMNNLYVFRKEAA
jgi:2-polyprenyl-3-methyl-5-hydroxy-6-metoxy-1,4-benzoquinol methylase